MRGISVFFVCDVTKKHKNDSFCHKKTKIRLEWQHFLLKDRIIEVYL